MKYDPALQGSCRSITPSLLRLLLLHTVLILSTVLLREDASLLFMMRDASNGSFLVSAEPYVYTNMSFAESTTFKIPDNATLVHFSNVNVTGSINHHLIIDVLYNPDDDSFNKNSSAPVGFELLVEDCHLSGSLYFARANTYKRKSLYLNQGNIVIRDNYIGWTLFTGYATGDLRSTVEFTLAHNSKFLIENNTVKKEINCFWAHSGSIELKILDSSQLIVRDNRAVVHSYVFGAYQIGKTSVTVSKDGRVLVSENSFASGASLTVGYSGTSGSYLWLRFTEGSSLELLDNHFLNDLNVGYTNAAKIPEITFADNSKFLFRNNRLTVGTLRIGYALKNNAEYQVTIANQSELIIHDNYIKKDLYLLYTHIASLEATIANSSAITIQENYVGQSLYVGAPQSGTTTMKISFISEEGSTEYPPLTRLAVVGNNVVTLYLHRYGAGGGDIDFSYIGNVGYYDCPKVSWTAGSSGSTDPSVVFPIYIANCACPDCGIPATTTTEMTETKGGLLLPATKSMEEIPRTMTMMPLLESSGRESSSESSSGSSGKTNSDVNSDGGERVSSSSSSGTGQRHSLRTLTHTIVESEGNPPPLTSPPNSIPGSTSSTSSSSSSSLVSSSGGNHPSELSIQPTAEPSSSSLPTIAPIRNARDVITKVVSEEVADATLATGSVSSVVGGVLSPGSAGQVRRVSAVLSIVHCRFASDEFEPTFVEHPLQLDLGTGTITATYAGSALLATLVIVLPPWVLLAAIRWIVVKRVERKLNSGKLSQSGKRGEENQTEESSASSAVASSSSPIITASAEDASPTLIKVQRILSMWAGMTLGYMAPVIIKSAVLVVFHSSNTTEIVVVVLCTFCVLCGPLGAALLANYRFIGAVDLETAQRVQLANSKYNRSGIFYTETYGSLFDAGRDFLNTKVRIYFLEEVAVTMVMMVIDGVKPEDGVCLGLAISLFVTTSLHILYLSVFRPYRAKIEMFFVALTGILLWCMAGLAIAATVNTENDSLVQWLVWIALGENYIFFIQAGAIAFWTYMRSEKKKVLASQARQGEDDDDGDGDYGGKVKSSEAVGVSMQSMNLSAGAAGAAAASSSSLSNPLLTVPQLSTEEESSKNPLLQY